jgi:hypothetical protein
MAKTGWKKMATFQHIPTPVFARPEFTGFTGCKRPQSSVRIFLVTQILTFPEFQLTFWSKIASPFPPFPPISSISSISSWGSEGPLLNLHDLALGSWQAQHLLFNMRQLLSLGAKWQEIAKKARKIPGKYIYILYIYIIGKYKGKPLKLIYPRSKISKWSNLSSRWSWDAS